MKSKYVIHTVGPMWDSKVDDQVNIDLLGAAVKSTLVMADTNLKVKSVSIPAISSGIFGFPKPLCALVFFHVIKAYALSRKQDEDHALEMIRLCNFDNETCSIFANVMNSIFPKKQVPEKEATKEEPEAKKEIEPKNEESVKKADQEPKPRKITDFFKKVDEEKKDA